MARSAYYDDVQDRFCLPLGLEEVNIVVIREVCSREQQSFGRGNNFLPKEPKVLMICQRQRDMAGSSCDPQSGWDYEIQHIISHSKRKRVVRGLRGEE